MPRDMADHFANSRWIAAPADLPSLPIFRRTFTLGKAAGRAFVHLCGLGQFELRVNGTKAGEDVLEPAWSDYRKTCYYITHDVTTLLRDGENIIDVWLGNGMYNVGAGNRYKKFKGSFGPPKFIAVIDVDSDRIVTDDAWRVAAGPITFSCIYGGEDYDAALENPADWQAVKIVDGPGGALIAQTSPPVRVMQTFRAARVSEPGPGKRVYDLGQNFSGRPVIAARGAANQKITLTTGELLDDHGNVTQKNTGAPVNFTYTLRGGGETETWRPRFTYTGFRYVQATGDLDALHDVQGEFLHSSAKLVGHFQCSNDLLNRIHTLILNAIKSNLQHVLTDCPHREKLGWLEQTHLMGSAIFSNFDVAALYAKIARDVRDAQHENGCVPTIAPQYTSFPPPWEVFNDSPEWGSAAAINPWLVYQRTGDDAILRDNYDTMKRYVEYLHTREQDGIIDYGLGDWYDIGPGDPGFSKLTSKALTATGIYFCDVTVLSAAAKLLNKSEDVHRYQAFSTRIREAFNRKFFDASTNRYDTGSQTAQAIALSAQLAAPADYQTVLDHLVADIRAHLNHITAGDIGFHFVIRALADNGRSDVIFDLLTRTDPPSYGAQLARGATTLTEAWDANPKNSQNHLMLGHADAWLYEYLAGIRIDLSQPPADRIIIRPNPVGDVTWCEARHESAVGPIAVRWDRSGEQFELKVEIPAGAEAAIYLPGDHGDPRRVAAGAHQFNTRL